MQMTAVNAYTVLLSTNEGCGNAGSTETVCIANNGQECNLNQTQ